MSPVVSQPGPKNCTCSVITASGTDIVYFSFMTGIVLFDVSAENDWK